MVSGYSVFQGVKVEQLVFIDGCVYLCSSILDEGVLFVDILGQVWLVYVEGKGILCDSFGDVELKKYFMYFYGVYFVEVMWELVIVWLWVSCVVIVIDVGCIINLMIGCNQIEGVIVMGVGMVLFEEIQYECCYGKVINSNLVDYVMIIYVDVLQIDVLFFDYLDIKFNVLGVCGIGEIGLVGFVVVVINVVYYVIGVCVCDLLVKIEYLFMLMVV